MPLHILVPMILIGLPLVIVLVYLTTRDRKQERLSKESAVQIFSRDFPNFIAHEVVLSDQADAAFILSDQQNEIGFVKEFGKNHLTRLLDREFLSKVEVTTSGIDLYVNDFTLNRISILMGNLESRGRIHELLVTR
ncbi:MAG: hypothetical protein AAGA53_01125 [Pseudomonadota bacterium]